MEQIRSADVLANFPQVDEEKLNPAQPKKKRPALPVRLRPRPPKRPKTNALPPKLPPATARSLCWTTTLPAYRRYMISMFIQIGR